VSRNASRKTQGKSVGSRAKNAAKRKRARTPRQTDFRSFGWYEKAALSVGISARAS